MSKIQLRDYQERLVDTIRDNFAKGHKSIMAVASTGAGKTIVFSYIADNAVRLGNRTFIFVHLKELVRQTSKSLTENNIPHGIIAAGFPLTDQPIQVVSIQTFIRRMHLFQVPELIICDESHHSVSASFKRLWEWQDTVDYSYRLGVTATPDRADRKGFTEYFDTFVEADDIRTLIANGWLVQPTIYSPPIPELDLNSSKLTRDGDFDQEFDALLLDRRVITGSAIEHYKRYLPDYPATIVFCATVQHCHNVAVQFTEAGIPSEAIDGSMDDEQRQAILDRLRSGETRCLMSCNLVSEGFDLPAVSAAIMLRRVGPKCMAMFMQMVGRVLRKSEGKTAAYIFDHVENTKRHIKAVLSFFSEDHKIDWRPSFEGRQKKPRASDELGKLETCPKCFMTFPAVPICPNCGHDFKKKGVGGGVTELEEVEGELVKFEADKLLTFRAIAAKGRPKQVIRKLERA